MRRGESRPIARFVPTGRNHRWGENDWTCLQRVRNWTTSCQRAFCCDMRRSGWPSTSSRDIRPSRAPISAMPADHVTERSAGRIPRGVDYTSSRFPMVSPCWSQNWAQERCTSTVDARQQTSTVDTGGPDESDLNFCSYLNYWISQQRFPDLNHLNYFPRSHDFPTDVH